MPIICRFYGISIRMYHRQKEHEPPHIHAIYGECMGTFLIENGEMTDGDIPVKGQQMIKEFINHYHDRLLYMWHNQQFEKLEPIF